MRITPLDVRKQEFRKAVRGLDADEVHAFLATVADEYEFVLTDNKKLREKVIELDEKVGEYRNMEKTLRDTLLTAERVMTEARQNARKEADLILRDAQMKASQEVAGINGRVESLHQQIRELRGHRDSYLSRLRSLSEAQLGLIDSYRKDFESTDHRVQRAFDHAADASTGAASEPADPTPAPHHPAPSIPAWDAPEPASQPEGRSPRNADDQWRSYDLGPERATPQVQAPSPPATGDHDARVSSVADAWSGAVPRVRPTEISDDEAAAIDEVSQALGMFTEDSDSLPEPASMEGESTSVPPFRGVPSSPWPADELAPDGLPTESVDQTGGAQGPADDSIDASTASDEQSGSEQGRWSLSRIARGLTGS